MRERLTSELAAKLYRDKWSACQIAAEYKVTRKGAEDKIRAAGLAGLAWCPVHGTYEALASR